MILRNLSDHVKSPRTRYPIFDRVFKTNICVPATLRGDPAFEPIACVIRADDQILNHKISVALKSRTR